MKHAYQLIANELKMLHLVVGVGFGYVVSRSALDLSDCDFFMI